MDEVVVSVGVITYNQKKYIKQCLDSILMQKTNFKFEVLINDDCSTDGTKEIVQDYVQKYPDIIKPTFQTENQYSKGKSIVSNFIFPRVRGKYFAICDGDDYWTDPQKLQKQYDFLENHLDYTVCFHLVNVIFDGYNLKSYTYPTENQIKQGFTFDNLIKYNFIQTNSVMYRWGFAGMDVHTFFPNGILPEDWYIHLLHAKNGKIGFLNEIMSVYRRNKNGIWSDSIEDVRKLHVKYALEELKFYDCVYKNITEKNENYLKTNFVPAYHNILRSLIVFNKKDVLFEAIHQYFDYFTLVLMDCYQNIDGMKIKQHKKKIYLRYYSYKFLSKITFGAKKKYYKEKTAGYLLVIKKLKQIL